MKNKQELFISEWKLFGPIYSDSIISGTDIMSHNQLSALSNDDMSFSIDDVKLKPNRIDSVYNSLNATKVKYNNERGYVELPKDWANAPNAIVYAESIVYSDIEKDIFFIVSSDDGIRLSLNNNILWQNTDRRKFYINSDYVAAHLKKGKNKIQLKLFIDKRFKNEKNKPWRFSCNVLDKTYCYERYLKSKQDYIKSPVVPLFHPLELKNKFHFSDQPYKYSIENDKGIIIEDGVLKDGDRNIEFKNRNSGLYQLVLYTKKDEFRQYFFYGDIMTSFSRERDSLALNYRNISEKDSLMIVPVLKRFDLVYSHYFPKRKVTIDWSKESAKDNEKIEILNFPSRFIEIPASQEVKVYSKGSNAITELRVYDKHYKILDVKTDKPEIFEVLNDNNLKSKWFPARKDDGLLNLKSEQADIKYIQLLAEQSGWEESHELKLVYLYKELLQMYNDILCENSIKDARHGTHLRTFVSPIDSSNQPYVIQIPECIDSIKGELSLIVSIPVAMTNKMHFLKSIVVAGITNLQITQYLVDKYKCIRIIPNSRTLTLENYPICEADIIANIEEVIAKYNIDRSRIYLTSICGGTTLALHLAEQYPNSFAALAMDAVSVKTKSQSKWDVKNLPINNTAKLKDMPIRIIQEEASTHTPYLKTKMLIDSLKENGNKPDVIIHKDSPKVMKEHLRNCDLAFSFVLKHKNEEFKDFNTYRDSNNELDILSVYGKPIKVIVGDSCRQLQKAYEKLWESHFFVKPPVISDREALKSDLTGFNLVVLGNALENTFVKDKMANSESYLVNYNKIKRSGGVNSFVLRSPFDERALFQIIDTQKELLDDFDLDKKMIFGKTSFITQETYLP